jgi:hypothetical protein
VAAAWQGKELLRAVYQAVGMPAARTAGCPNGPTEALNLLIKKVKRVGHGFRNFDNSADDHEESAVNASTAPVMYIWIPSICSWVMATTQRMSIGKMYMS